MNFLNSQKIIRFGLFVSLLTPLVFVPWMWRPSQTSKFLFFLFFIELIFLIAISLFKFKPVFQLLRHPVILWSGAYTFFVGISSLFGVDPWNSFFGNDIRVGGWLLLVHAWFFCTLLFVYLDEVSWRFAEKIFVLSGALISLYAILEALNVFPSLGEIVSRSSSILGNPIYLAAYLIFPLTIALQKSLSTEKETPWFYVVSTFLIFLGILVSGTRGAFLGLVAGGAVMGILHLKNSKNRKRIFISLLGVLFACISVVIVARMYIPSNSFYGRYVYFADSNIISRLEFWKMAARGVLERPLAGVGYENYYHVSEKYYAPILYRIEGSYSDKPHNAFIEIIVCSGLIGLLLYFFLLYQVVNSILVSRRQNRITDLQEGVLYFGLTAYLIQNFFAFDTIGSFFTFSFFLAYVAFLNRGQSIKFEVRNKKMQVFFLTLSAILISVLFIVFFLPTYQLFSTLTRTQSNPNFENRFLVLQSISANAFIYNHNVLGKMYHNGSKQLYEKVGKTPLVMDYVQSALFHYNISVQKHSKRGEYWYQKADMGLFEAFLSNKQISEETRYAVNRAIELTPTRTEPYLLKATELEMDGRIEDAVTMLEELYAQDIQSDKLAWTLSVLHAKTGNNDRSALLGYEAIKGGLTVYSLTSVLEIINFYAEKNDIEKVIVLYKKATNIFPDKIDLHANLAAAYAANGQIDEAIASARKYAELNPQAKAETEAFIQSLQK